MSKTRINVANPQELLEIPDFDLGKVDAVLRHRAEHGPIRDPAELGTVLGTEVTTSAADHIDFAPAGESATESAGG